MYERFTDRARKVMQLANQSSLQLNHEFIGTEHILFGILKEASGVAANVLKNLGFDLESIRAELAREVQPGPDGMVVMGKLPQTPCAQRAIGDAVKEARGLRHNYVGTEHLLLGLLANEEVFGGRYLSVASRILRRLGVEVGKVREGVVGLLYRGVDPSKVVPGPRTYEALAAAVGLTASSFSGAGYDGVERMAANPERKIHDCDDGGILITPPGSTVTPISFENLPTAVLTVDLKFSPDFPAGVRRSVCAYLEQFLSQKSLPGLKVIAHSVDISPGADAAKEEVIWAPSESLAFVDEANRVPRVPPAVWKESEVRCENGVLNLYTCDVTATSVGGVPHVEKSPWSFEHAVGGGEAPPHAPKALEWIDSTAGSFFPALPPGEVTLRAKKIGFLAIVPNELLGRHSGSVPDSLIACAGEGPSSPVAAAVTDEPIDPWKCVTSEDDWRCAGRDPAGNRCMKDARRVITRGCLTLRVCTEHVASLRTKGDEVSEVK